MSFSSGKPMDVFGPLWEDHARKIKERWCLGNDDVAVLAGDTSWAMNFDELESDFDFLKSLKGKKIILKGNHDFWWTSVSKMNKFSNSFGDIVFLHNNTFETEDFYICGTRGWLLEPGEKHDEKITLREAGRLRFSLECWRKTGSEKPALVFLHYPPVFGGEENSEIINALLEYGIKDCFYAHLHGSTAHSMAVRGEYKGINLHLISADFLDFYPCKL